MASMRSTSIVIISLLISILLKCCEPTHDNVRGRESERGRERVRGHEFEREGPLRKVTKESRRAQSAPPPTTRTTQTTNSWGVPLIPTTGKFVSHNVGLGLHGGRLFSPAAKVRSISVIPIERIPVDPVERAISTVAYPGRVSTALQLKLAENKALGRSLEAEDNKSVTGAPQMTLSASLTQVLAKNQSFGKLPYAMDSVGEGRLNLSTEELIRFLNEDSQPSEVNDSPVHIQTDFLTENHPKSHSQSSESPTIQHDHLTPSEVNDSPVHIQTDFLTENHPKSHSQSAQSPTIQHDHLTTHSDHSVQHDSKAEPTPSELGFGQEVVDGVLVFHFEQSYSHAQTVDLANEPCPAEASTSTPVSSSSKTTRKQTLTALSEATPVSSISKRARRPTLTAISEATPVSSISKTARKQKLRPLSEATPVSSISERGRRPTLTAISEVEEDEEGILTEIPTEIPTELTEIPTEIPAAAADASHKVDSRENERGTPSSSPGRRPRPPPRRHSTVDTRMPIQAIHKPEFFLRRHETSQSSSSLMLTIFDVISLAANTIAGTEFAAENDLKFHYFARKILITDKKDWYDHLVIDSIKDAGKMVKLIISQHFDKRIVIFVHGFLSDESLIDDYAQEYMAEKNYQVIGISWIKGSSSTMNYSVAKDRAIEVGKQLGELVYELVRLGVPISWFICVGHSLGAHICGIAGHEIKIRIHPLNPALKLIFPIIIGLDPAKILFQMELTDEADRVDDGDAFVVAIHHTAGGYFGVEVRIGTLDIFWNGGIEQPGCNRLRGPYPTDFCSHTRVHALHFEAMKRKDGLEMVECQSISSTEYNCQIDDDTQIRRGHSELDPINVYRSNGEGYLKGVFYAKTRDNAPYLMDVKQYGIKQAVIDTSAVSIFNRIKCLMCAKPIQSVAASKRAQPGDVGGT